MYKNQSKSNFRSWLLAGAAVAVATGSAYAQQGVETVVVTGSLIQRSAGDMPTPTVVLSSEAIQKTGQPNLSGVLSELPQIQNSSGAGDLTPVNSNFLTSGFGVWNVDLRNLGASRTLVLVNGRRQVTGSPTGSAVDLNTIPTALVEHIDVITGGASAAYGSDAIAGVVNIILKKDFQGVAANVQTGLSARGDGADTYGTVTLGGNFANDRGNVALSVSYEHSGAVMSKDRDLTVTDSTWSPGGLPGYDTFSSYGLAGRFRLTTVTNAATGQIGATGTAYNPNGTAFVTSVNGYNRNPQRYIQVPVTRKVVAATGHYDLTNWLSFFLESTYALTSSASQLEPYPGTSEDGVSKSWAAGGTGILIPRTNPFIAAQGTGVGSIYAALAAAPTSPGLFYYRRFADLGDRTGSVDRNLAKITFGFEGTLPFKDWKWSSYYEFGRTAESQFNGGYYDKIKMQEALNVVSTAQTASQLQAANIGYVTLSGTNYVCSNPVAVAAGCVPINLFGAGSITSAAAKYVGSQVTLQDHQDEQVASFQANGSLFTLPAGAVKVAVGGEYRHEEADFVPDAASQAGSVAGNKIPRTTGAFQVSEVFGEGVLPILKDLPGVKYLELGGAVRWAHYSTAGDATSWKYNILWQVIDDVKFRGAYSSATRAPNIGELFTPAAQTFPGISQTTDPCIAPTAGTNAATNCATMKAALGTAVNPSYTGQLGLAAAQGVGGYASGNSSLKPETAHTLTLGVVFTPSWAPGLQATVDAYDIRLYGAIGSLGAADTLSACYNASPSLYASNIFCKQITRVVDSSLGPIVRQIDFPTFNLGSLKTSGIDTSISYAFALADLAPGLESAGAFALQYDMNYLNSSNSDPGIPGTEIATGAGTIGTPHFRSKLRIQYTNDPWTITSSIHYTGGAVIFRDYSFIGNSVPAQYTVDLNVTYALNEKTDLYVGARNLFDVQPPEIFPGSGYSFATTGTGTSADIYDPIGMYLYAGVQFKM